MEPADSTVVAAFCMITKYIYLLSSSNRHSIFCQVSVAEICCYLDFNLDDSYTAKKSEYGVAYLLTTS